MLSKRFDGKAPKMRKSSVTSLAPLQPLERAAAASCVASWLALFVDDDDDVVVGSKLSSLAVDSDGKRALAASIISKVMLFDVCSCST